jgi:hypothetical protein
LVGRKKEEREGKEFSQTPQDFIMRWHEHLPHQQELRFQRKVKIFGILAEKQKMRVNVNLKVDFLLLLLFFFDIN